MYLILNNDFSLSSRSTVHFNVRIGTKVNDALSLTDISLRFLNTEVHSCIKVDVIISTFQKGRLMATIMFSSYSKFYGSLL